ncbi:MAG: intermembrane transport protein PqiB [Candidatus Rokuibacteriota bacterium]
MTSSGESDETADALPAARVKRRRWTFAIVWIVPLVAGIVASYLIYGRLNELGPAITIRFRDGSGVKAGQTEVRYRGVPVGQVTAVELSRRREHVLVKARLRRSAASLAREGSLFWIVRPEVGFGTVRGLSTVITGPYIQALAGTGKAKSQFTGLEHASPTMGQAGLKVTLSTVQLGSIRPGSPVHYRGIEVGSVTGIDLSSDATAAHVQVFIPQRYERLVRIGSRFWTVSGVDVNFGLLRGLEINVESLRALATGGIAFATPDDPGASPAKDGSVFLLHDKPQSDWLEWRPKITIAPAG